MHGCSIHLIRKGREFQSCSTRKLTGPFFTLRDVVKRTPFGAGGKTVRVNWNVSDKEWNVNMVDYFYKYS